MLGDRGGIAQKVATNSVMQGVKAQVQMQEGIAMDTAEEVADTWSCQICTLINVASTTECQACGQEKILN